MACHIKKGDTVEVIAGDDRGVRGRVLSVNSARGRVIIEGVNRVFKHVRPSQKNPQGGRLEVERSIDISNVLPVSSKSNRPMRVHFELAADGSKSRVAADGAVIDVIKHAKR